MTQTPALDFLRKVEVWQKTEGGTAGVGVVMPAGEETTLDQLLATFRHTGPTTALEEQARYWLIGYRETERFSPTLTTDQKHELDTVIARLPSESATVRLVPQPRRRVYSGPFPIRIVLGAMFGLILALCLVVAGRAIWSTTHPANSAPTGTQQVQQNPPAAQVQPGTTVLQNFMSDWGPWTQLPVSQQNPFSGAPALLFMDHGGYYASKDWTVPANSPAWSADLGGNVNNVDIQGNHALITDMDGDPYVVTINQAFVFASNPQTVLRIDPTGAVYSIPEAHAIAVRKSL